MFLVSLGRHTLVLKGDNCVITKDPLDLISTGKTNPADTRCRDWCDVLYRLEQIQSGLVLFRRLMNGLGLPCPVAFKGSTKVFFTKAKIVGGKLFPNYYNLRGFRYLRSKKGIIVEVRRKITEE